MSASLQPDANKDGRVQEIRGLFPSDASLRDAVSRLTAAGFDRSRLIMPVFQAVGSSATPNEAAQNADTEEGARQMRTLRSSTAAAAAAMAGAAVVVATGGAALAAVAVAAGAGVAAGGGILAGGSIAESAVAAGRDSAAADGRLVLIVSVATSQERALAESSMHEAGASAVESLHRPEAGVPGK